MNKEKKSDLVKSIIYMLYGVFLLFLLIFIKTMPVAGETNEESYVQVANELTASEETETTEREEIKSEEQKKQPEQDEELVRLKQEVEQKTKIENEYIKQLQGTLGEYRTQINEKSNEYKPILNYSNTYLHAQYDESGIAYAEDMNSFFNTFGTIAQYIPSIGGIAGKFFSQTMEFNSNRLYEGMVSMNENVLNILQPTCTRLTQDIKELESVLKFYEELLNEDASIEEQITTKYILQMLNGDELPLEELESKRVATVKDMERLMLQLEATQDIYQYALGDTEENLQYLAEIEEQIKELRSIMKKVRREGEELTREEKSEVLVPLLDEYIRIISLTQAPAAPFPHQVNRELWIYATCDPGGRGGKIYYDWAAYGLCRVKIDVSFDCSIYYRCNGQPFYINRVYFWENEPLSEYEDAEEALEMAEKLNTTEILRDSRNIFPEATTDFYNCRYKD